MEKLSLKIFLQLKIYFNLIVLIKYLHSCLRPWSFKVADRYTVGTKKSLVKGFLSYSWYHLLLPPPPRTPKPHWWKSTIMEWSKRGRESCILMHYTFFCSCLVIFSRPSRYLANPAHPLVPMYYFLLLILFSLFDSWLFKFWLFLVDLFLLLLLEHATDTYLCTSICLRFTC